MKKYALISVSDKTKIIELAKAIALKGYEILATGNTANILIENQIECTEVSDFTGFPEIFSGRVKSLHPKVFGGILLRRTNKEDLLEAAKNNVYAIDIVCVNLYPFGSVVKRDDVDDETKIENIDIGGPSLIRAAAKNYKYVSVLTHPDQYEKFTAELETDSINEDKRKVLASAAFAHTAEYDNLIANYFDEKLDQTEKNLRINLSLKSELRYGENPHQRALLYGKFYEYFSQLHGKELSYNNIIDLVAANNLVNDLGTNACAIIKHTNPCGAAIGTDLLDAYIKALSGDPVSVFGGIVAFNEEVDAVLAEKLNEIFTEVIVAPSFTNSALEILKKKKNRRILKTINKGISLDNIIKSIPGGIIVQDNDNSIFPSEYKIVTERSITSEELENLKFAWTICKHTKSNAIVFCKNLIAIGVGAGQMSRVDSSRIAVSKAKQHSHSLQGAVAASDAFFPFADGVEEIAKNGITAIVQPGGSIRDNEVIEAANNNNISMIFTGIRNFKH